MISPSNIPTTYGRRLAAPPVRVHAVLTEREVDALATMLDRQGDAALSSGCSLTANRLHNRAAALRETVRRASR